MVMAVVTFNLQERQGMRLMELEAELEALQGEQAQERADFLDRERLLASQVSVPRGLHSYALYRHDPM